MCLLDLLILLIIEGIFALTEDMGPEGLPYHNTHHEYSLRIVLVHLALTKVLTTSLPLVSFPHEHILGQK